MNVGFKAMLRDRCPETVNIALKWCKAKERWINHTYDNFVAIYKDKKNKNETVHTLLGLNKKHKNFDFKYTIAWDSIYMDEESIKYWKWVESWVNWFSKNYLCICNHIKIAHKSFKYSPKESELGIADIKNTYLSTLPPENAEKLAKYLYECIMNSEYYSYS